MKCTKVYLSKATSLKNLAISLFLLSSLFYTIPLFSQIQIGADIDGEGELDAFGANLALAANATRVGGGGAGNIAGGTQFSGRGHARIFDTGIPATPVPVEMTSFSVQVSLFEAQLKWITSAEINNYGFNVEKSTDGLNWKRIGFLRGNGNSTIRQTYTFLILLLLKA